MSYTAPLPPSPPYDEYHFAFSPPIAQLLSPETPNRTPRTSMTLSTPQISTDNEMDYHRRYSSRSRHSNSFGISKKRRKGPVVLEDFELIRVLGKGCAGRVLLVRHAHKSTIHAMKAISKRSVLAQNELNHTITELNILKDFATTTTTTPPNYSDHNAHSSPDSIYSEGRGYNDFISRLNYAFTDRENFYFVMDFYPGGDLATQMEIHGILGHHRTRFYAADITEGLEQLHRHGVMVRDLKPENILLNSKGHAVLADFGLSKQFAYRGDPQPIYVGRYDGQTVLPIWAGRGIGSLRQNEKGQRKIVTDRADSFVGTADYLAPEVVRRNEYTYAVDWWALGIIVFEGLVGMVPFRKADDDPPSELWNRILDDPWDYFLDDSRFRNRRLSDWNIDPATAEFINALLQKDPMWRITEPFVKRHAYFAEIDWDTVRRGEYGDPHELNLHPMAEYNTRYFPQLCLEEEPSVDMSTHDSVHPDDLDSPLASPAKSALNDHQRYMEEQDRFREELDNFYWSQDDIDMSDQITHGLGAGRDRVMSLDRMQEHDIEGDFDEEVEDEARPYIERRESEESRASLGGSHLRAYDSSLSLDKISGALISGESHQTQRQIEGYEEWETTKSLVEGMLVPSESTSTDGDLIAVGTPNTVPITLPSAVSAMEIGSPAPFHKPDQIPLGPDQKMRSSTTFAPTLPASASRPTSPPLPIPIKSPLRTAARPIPTTTSNNLIRPQTQRLPSGLPSSGLSVSDVVSIPSPLSESHRIYRRHQNMPSIDSPPLARLSVELYGTITRLGDEDWEALDEDMSNIPSVPNGLGHNYGHGPSSFFNRLRGKPSMIVTSGLRRQTTSKSSDSSRDSSPTKVSGRNFFGSNPSNGNTNKKGGKGLKERFKVFPRLRNKKSDINKSQETANPPSPDKRNRWKEIGPSQSAQRPEQMRRHTESNSNWLRRNKDKSRSKKSPQSVSGVSRDGSVSTNSTRSGQISELGENHNFMDKILGGSEGNMRDLKVQKEEEDNRKKEDITSQVKAVSENGDNPPRVELKNVGPVIWEWEGEVGYVEDLDKVLGSSQGAVRSANVFRKNASA